MTNSTSTQYQMLGMGGSFDHFHDGHAQFVLQASKHAAKLLIGVTSDAWLRRKKYPESLETYAVRFESLDSFCKKNQLNVEIVELTDPYGPTLENSQVDGLWVTTETRPGAELINRVRTERKLPTLPILECEMVPDESGQELHSDRIRAGIVSRTGKIWANPLQNTLTLTTAQRSHLTQPQGKISPSTEQFSPPPGELTTVVGDQSLETFIQNHWPYRLGVYDRRRTRKAVSAPLIDQLQPELHITNPPGQITRELSQALQTSLAENHLHLQVDGEEDLAAVALVLLLPLNHYVIYGQPKQGLVTMVITETLKTQIYQLLMAPAIKKPAAV